MMFMVLPQLDVLTDEQFGTAGLVTESMINSPLMSVLMLSDEHV
jgi:hypothetical protein